ncbi:MAG: hypothetical protein JNM27_08000 [Leptospirales bacterium]|nr:hypothetical protein [Leptospirales bacterium]
MNGDNRFPYPAVRRKLLKWFKANARSYPWRTTSNWFHLLMAEMMLRRTRANQAARVYVQFTQQFETPADSAKVESTVLLKMFEPLGLAWRGRQLLQTLDFLSDSYAKRRPEPSDDLFAIPGVGDYSNAMLRNRLFNERLPALDSNMARLICRIEGWSYSAEARRKRQIIEVAHKLVQIKASRELNLAILDFSALVCKPVHPVCVGCPLASHCSYGRKRLNRISGHRVRGSPVNSARM